MGPFSIRYRCSFSSLNRHIFRRALPTAPVLTDAKLTVVALKRMMCGQYHRQVAARPQAAAPMAEEKARQSIAMGTRFDAEGHGDHLHRDDGEVAGGRGGDDGEDSGQQQGIALRWNAERGFGFIKPDDGGDDVFCHFSAITDGAALEEGSTVWYTKCFDDHRGKDRAENVSGGVQKPDVRSRGGGGVGECYDFQKGRCTRGSSCKFSHGTGDSGGGYGGGGGGRYGGGYGGGDRYGGGGDGGRY